MIERLHPRRAPAPHRQRRGMTLIEAVMCSLLVGVMMVAALRAAGASSVLQRSAGESARARAFAGALLAEIMQQHYAPPASSSGDSGLLSLLLGGSSTSTTTGRMGFDDVSDYNGYSETKITNRDGSIISSGSSYGRQVSVTLVSPSDPAQIVSSDQGAKRIRVTVTRNGRTLARMVAVRTDTR